MAETKVYNQQNQEVGTMPLAENVFQVTVKPEILHLIVRAHLAKVRSGTVGVKTRAFVSGGGKKPWRQKGTGNARAGSNRSPIWRGGAVVHGPQARSYAFKVNAKVRSLALKMALSTKLADNSLKIVDKIVLDKVKTKDFVKVREALGLKKTLLVLGKIDTNAVLSARNLRGITVVPDDGVNVYEILRHQHLVIDQSAVERLQERLK